LINRFRRAKDGVTVHKPSTRGESNQEIVTQVALAHVQTIVLGSARPHPGTDP
jgi:hypothetical protein